MNNDRLCTSFSRAGRRGSLLKSCPVGATANTPLWVWLQGKRSSQGRNGSTTLTFSPRGPRPVGSTWPPSPPTLIPSGQLSGAHPFSPTAAQSTALPAGTIVCGGMGSIVMTLSWNELAARSCNAEAPGGCCASSGTTLPARCADLEQFPTGEWAWGWSAW